MLIAAIKKKIWPSWLTRFIEKYQPLGIQQPATKPKREESFRHLLSESDDSMVVVSHQGQVIFANRAAESLFNCSAERLLGQDFFGNLVVETSSCEINTETIPFVGETKASSRRIVQTQVEVMRLQGKNAIAQMRVLEIEWEDERAYLISLRDITERQQAEAERRKIEELYRTLARNFPNGAVLLFDSQLRYTLAEGVGLAEVGLSKEFVEGKTLAEVFSPEVCQQIESAHRAALVGRSTVQEVSFAHRIYLMHTVPVKNDQGEIFAGMVMTQDITERKQAEEALRESEAKLQKLTANVPGMIYQCLLHENGFMSLPYVSSGCQELYELSPIELMQRANLFEWIHPDDQQSCQNSMAACAQTLEPWKWEGRCITKSGELKWIQGAARPEKLSTGEILWNGLFVDITERKRSEEMLKRFRQAVESSSDAIGMTDANGKHIYHNPAFTKLFHYKTPEDLHSDGGTTTVFAEPQIGEEVLATLMKGQSWIGEVEQRSQQGNKMQMLLRADAIKDATGELVGFVSIHTDISDRKRTEEALRQSESILRHQAQQLKNTLRELQRTQGQLIQNEKMVSLGQLIAGIAHEINNPASFIYGNVNPANEYLHDLLSLVELYQHLYPQPNSEIQELAHSIDLNFLKQDFPKLLKSMQVGAERIREIVLSLRNFSRLDEDGMKPVDLHEGIENTLLILGHRLKNEPNKASIQLIKDYGDLPAVECCAGQLNQVFMNILSNAIDALEESRSPEKNNPENDSEPDSLGFLPTIRISTQVEGDRAVIRIQDNGPGMSAEVRDRLFDPFFTTKPVGQGTGLGLSISYQIVVEKHAGELTCVSTPGEGAEFAIAIPLQPSLVKRSLVARATSTVS